MNCTATPPDDPELDAAIAAMRKIPGVEGFLYDEEIDAIAITVLQAAQNVRRESESRTARQLAREFDVSAVTKVTA